MLKQILKTKYLYNNLLENLKYIFLWEVSCLHIVMHSAQRKFEI